MKRIYKLDTNLKRDENTKLLNNLDEIDVEILSGLELKMSLDLVDEDDRITTIMIGNILNVEKIKSFLFKNNVNFELSDITNFFIDECDSERIDDFLNELSESDIFEKLGVNEEG